MRTMLGRRVVAMVTVGLLGIGCRPELPPAAPRELPVPDGKRALLGDRPLSPRLASYELRVALDVPSHTVSGRAVLTWRHAGRDPVEEIPLHLYMNAFRGPRTPFMSAMESARSEWRSSGEDGWGGIEVTSIVDRSAGREGGAELRPGARAGEDDTILLVPLGRAVAPGETLVLEMSFTTRLPRIIARTGWVDDFIMVGQWFPKIGVLSVDPDVDSGAQRWHASVFHATSEFFADFGTYDVELTVPDTHVVAATGVLVDARPAAAGTRTLVYRAEDVHDFAWMADPHMKIARGTARTAAGEIELRVYHRPGHEAYAPRHLEAARRTIETWSRLLVPYPWPVMSVIDPPWNAMIGAGGMEYPTLVTAGGAIDLRGVFLAEEVTVHEITHNWFQGIVASNEVEEPFLDEGLTQYMTGIIMDDLFGPERSVLDTFFLRLGYFDTVRLQLDAAELASPAASASYAMAPGEYGPATYYKTAQTLATLEGMVGRERLLAALGLYARRHAFGHPTRADLLAALRDGLGEDFGWFLEPALLGSGAIDVRVGKVVSRRDDAGVWDNRVAVERLGPIPARVDVLVRFDDGSEHVEVWEARAPHHTFVLPKQAGIAEVVLDPHGKLVLERDVRDNRHGDKGGGRLRAAARAGFWVQTLGGLVGL